MQNFQKFIIKLTPFSAVCGSVEKDFSKNFCWAKLDARLNCLYAINHNFRLLFIQVIYVVVIFGFVLRFSCIHAYVCMYLVILKKIIIQILKFYQINKSAFSSCLSMILFVKFIFVYVFREILLPFTLIGALFCSNT